MTHENNLKLITSSLPAEVKVVHSFLCFSQFYFPKKIAAGETVVGPDLARLVEVANETCVALNFEEKMLAGKKKKKLLPFLFHLSFQIKQSRCWAFWKWRTKRIPIGFSSVPTPRAFGSGFQAGDCGTQKSCNLSIFLI